jgi:hypothetical protein
MQIVEFLPNEPQQMTLERDSRPYSLPNGAGCLYTLSDGRIMHLSPECARAVADLKLGPEEIRVCLHQRGSGLAYWSAWLSPETEKARAAAETPELERQLAASIEIASRRRRSPETAVCDRGALPPTGTDGPAPLPALSRKPAIAAVASGKRKPEGPIPYNVAFREIVKLVASELLQASEQWSDQARQDAVSTLFIAAGKAGWLGVWEREDAA